MEQTIKSSNVFVNSYSCVTPFGVTPEALWKACEVSVSQFEDGLLKISKNITKTCYEEIKNEIKAPVFKGVEDNELLIWSLYALKKSLNLAKWNSEDKSTGLIIATTTGLTKNWEGELMKHFRDESVSGHVYNPLNSFAVELIHQLNFLGPVQIVSSACCAGTQAIGMARQWLQSNFVERCLVLGSEQICQLTDSGFRSLSLVTGEDCYPFNENHNSICMSEGAAVLCLDKNKSTAKAKIAGYGCSSDAHSMTAPKPDGSGPKASMRMALDEAQLNPDQIDWVHAHGTGSLQNDRAEAAAIMQLEMNCQVTSTKGVHGHTLAASGVLETIICLKALENNVLLPTLGAEPKHFNIFFAEKMESKPLRNILKNTLGFGGINSSLIFTEVNSDA